jgi:hypothetical protein
MTKPNRRVNLKKTLEWFAAKRSALNLILENESFAVAKFEYMLYNLYKSKAGFWGFWV